MLSSEIRQKFLKFFEEKGHKIVPSSSLVPEGDSSVLFTTAGMQQFKPYYLGKESPYGKNVVSVQKCVRTSDIDEVGDESHLTFFEMLGNFSFGGYFKEEAIKYAWEFMTKIMNTSPERMHVTVHESTSLGRDEESYKIWREKIGLPEDKIKFGGIEDLFWGPTGDSGPCGPTTEIYVDGLEVWNIVFNQYFSKKSRERSLKEGWEFGLDLPTPGVDTGMGLERLAMVSQKVPTVFDTDLFNFADNPKTKEGRITADHLRAASFMISDGIRPSNKGAGSILRRLMRTIVSYGNVDFKVIVEKLISEYKNSYDNLDARLVISEFEKEKLGYAKTYESTKKALEKKSSIELTGVEAFNLSSTLGIRVSDILKIADEIDISPSPAYEEELEDAVKKHQDVSRAGAEQKFKGGLAGHSEMEVKYHTATHLLHQALHDVLGDEVEQRGSNITPERLRFDFSFPRKLKDDEKQRVEEIVNGKIKQNLPVNKIVMSKTEALKSGARHSFDEKYSDEVSIYYIGGSLKSAYSKEFCGGPHVGNTAELRHFRITNEESSSAGVRRIKAVLE